MFSIEQLSFNPCFNGFTTSTKLLGFGIGFSTTVSILVLMDSLLQPVFSIKSFIYQYYRDFFRH